MKLVDRSSFWRRALRVAGQHLLHLAENNGDVRAARNGELRLLRELLTAHAAGGGGRPFVACDGGANRGEYTRLLLQEAGRAGTDIEVHAFEPSPHCVDELRQAFGSEPKVHIVGAALADHAGEAMLFNGGSGSSLASLVPRNSLAAGAAAAVPVPLMRLGDYLSAQGLARVDLLKLDVEGSELAALKGLGDQLRPEVVGVIQFEYGATTLDAGTTLGAIYALLEARGYAVGKIFPRAVEVRPYRAWMETYAYANYVAFSPAAGSAKG